MPLDTSQLQDYLFCTNTGCKQFCPTRHPEIDRWYQFHAKNCRPKPSQVRTGGQPETYIPWLPTHIKMSNEILEGYRCAISDVELLALMGGSNGSSGSSGPQGPEGYR
jgi:hypothetical protein